MSKSEKDPFVFPIARSPASNVSVLRRLSLLLTEFRNIFSLLTSSARRRRIVFYSEDAATWTQLEGYVRPLIEKHGESVVYITSDVNDPLLERPPPNLDPIYVDRLLGTLIPQLEAGVLVMTMPDLGSFHVQPPGPKTLTVYVFHSLNSVHASYRPCAFDHYDAFFCTGPHHREELTAALQKQGQSVPRLFDVGYPKLDRMHADHAAFRDRSSSGEGRGTGPGTRTILVAPSWGPGNLLEAGGVQLLKALRGTGHSIILRPHPCFLLPIYPKGPEILAEIEASCRSDDGFSIDTDFTSEKSFHRGDLLVSGWSGAASEYAFATERPVLFIDVPRKVFNPDWERLGRPTFEDLVRSRVGRIIRLDEFDKIPEAVEEMLGAPEAYRNQIRAMRQESIYNMGEGGANGARIILDLLAERGWETPMPG